MPGARRTCDDRGVSVADLTHDSGPDSGTGGADHAPTRVRKLYRIPEGRMISGVANGLAAHLGVPVFWVRATFVVLLLGNGLGALLYAAFWFAVPMGLRAGSAPRVWQSGDVGPYSLEKEPQGWRRVRQALQQTLQSRSPPAPGRAPAAAVGRCRTPRCTAGRCWR
jgi:phage shock protein PspC (stress-responsive transcriptional regulator)